MSNKPVPQWSISWLGIILAIGFLLMLIYVVANPTVETQPALPDQHEVAPIIDTGNSRVPVNDKGEPAPAPATDDHAIIQI